MAAGIVSLKQDYFLLLRMIANADADAKTFSQSHNEIDNKLIEMEESIRWELFAEYCNTPCYRYRA